jgi:hypothetical protein
MALFAKKKQATATIVRIWDQPPPGAPWYYWVYVLFESRGERIKIHLKKRQAKSFVDNYREGDTGFLEYQGDRMLSWKLASESQPLMDASHISVFISYAHEWSEDAAYIAQVFRTHGLSVWLDVDRLRVGDKLNRDIVRAIQQSIYFVPLLSPEYFSSAWCLKEFEQAIQAGVDIMPIKVSTGELVFPPHIRRLYSDVLGEPVFLDIRGRDPSTQLKELARQMVESVR